VGVVWIPTIVAAPVVVVVVNGGVGGVFLWKKCIPKNIRTQTIRCSHTQINALLKNQ